MSTTAFLVGAIATVVVLLLAIAFIYQTVDNKRKQQQRLLSALKSRAKNFQYMLSGFPENFLSKDLTVLLNRSLIDIYEQVSKLDPRDQSCIEEIQVYTNKLAEAQRSQNTVQRVHMNNPQQIKEVRIHLQELHKFIEKLLRRHVVNSNQAKVYSKQIQKLLLQISVDAYMLYARQAQQGQKIRLAAHYYTLAKKLLVRENAQQTYTKQIEKLDAIVRHLEKQIGEETKAKPTMQAVAPAKSKEWDQFDEVEAGWKKKTVYD